MKNNIYFSNKESFEKIKMNYKFTKKLIIFIK